MSDLSSFPEWDELSFRALNEDLASGERWSTWGSVERLCRGPAPHPDWSLEAIDTDLGTIKSGKEADVVLIERAVPSDPEQSCLMAAKRYRSGEHRMFHRDAVYSEGRRIRNTRDTRALQRGSAHGRRVQAGLWAQAEWTALIRLHSAGVPVPYPVQIDGTEILLEYLTAGEVAAPRLHQVRADPLVLADLYEQLHSAMRTMAQLLLVHGDLSPYNTLLADDTCGRKRLVIIDVPQMVDLVANPAGPGLLQRDCVNMAAWFTSSGHPVDAETLFAELLGLAW
ncbi:MAG: serine protein kinase RIO [Candidatus Nanopelagicales bacterium]